MKNINEKHISSSQQYANILGVRLDSTCKEEVLKSVKEKIAKKIQFYIVTPNPEIIVAAQSDPELSHSLAMADISVPDGVGVVIAARLLGKSLKLIKGRELMLSLLAFAEEENWKVFMLGATPTVNAKLLLEVKKRFPNLKAEGASGPRLNNDAMPVTKVDSKIESDVIKQINTLSPHILYVAFGTPKEQKWMAKWLPKLKTYCAMEVGGSFDYLSGVTQLPPNWISAVGLEWLWRGISDPKRIGRIFNALVLFPILFVKSRLTRGG